jgi:hypothetical protein
MTHKNNTVANKPFHVSFSSPIPRQEPCTSGFPTARTCLPPRTVVHFSTLFIPSASFVPNIKSPCNFLRTKRENHSVPKSSRHRKSQQKNSMTTFNIAETISPAKDNTAFLFSYCSSGMSTPKRSRTSIIRSHDDDDPVRVEIQGFYWPRLLVVKHTCPDNKKRPIIKIPRKLNKADKKSKALLLRQLIKSAKSRAEPSLASATHVPPPVLPSLMMDVSISDQPYTFAAPAATPKTVKTCISSWKPASPMSITSATRVTGKLWPHRVPVSDDYSFSNSRPSSPTSIMGPHHHHHQRPRAVTFDVN